MRFDLAHYVVFEPLLDLHNEKIRGLQHIRQEIRIALTHGNRAHLHAETEGTENRRKR